MTKSNFTIKLLIVILLFASHIVNAQQPPSAEIIKKLEQDYKKISNPEITLDQFIKSNRHVYETKPVLPVNKAAMGLAIAGNCTAISNFCNNGDFESGTIDASKWLSGYGTFSGIPDPATMTTGIVGGPLNSSSAHQTIVGNGTDPITGISLTSLNGGNYSLRLGNSINGNGTELIGKTIVIDSSASILSFWYAVVFEDPSHAPVDQPAFTVRVFDCATGQELSGVCNLGNGSNKVVSNSRNPFFRSNDNKTIAYRDWTRGEIFLSNYIGKTVTIYFINNDCNLGGHYGYTYLDNFCSSSFFVREPTDALKGNDAIVNDPDAISDLVMNTGQNRYGISADGVTRLLIIKPSAKTLTFSVPAAEDGQLSSLNDQSTKKTSIDIVPIKNSKGDSYVIAVYTAPDSYGTKTPLRSDGRTTQISVLDKSDPASKQAIAMNIFTPPVVMVHGMWGDPDTWIKTKFAERLKNAQFPKIELVDYRANSYSTFSIQGKSYAQYPLGVQNLFKSTSMAVNFYKNSSIAATQVDVVAHSLGGLMSRSFIQTKEYSINENFKKGYVHKLITLGTPHLGSPLGGYAWDHRNDPIDLYVYQTTLGDALAYLKMPVGSVHPALQPGSPDLLSIQQSNVKSFAIVGNYKPDETDLYDGLNYVLKKFDKSITSLDAFLGEDNDAIVGITSQQGGLASTYSQTFSNTAHTILGNTETKSVLIQNKVKDLLLSDDASLFSPSIPAPSFLAKRMATTTAITASNKQLSDSDYIRIISPVRGSVFASNKPDSITLEIATGGNISIASGIFWINGIGVFDMPLSPPYRVKFKLPLDAPVGTVNILALAEDTSGVILGDTASIFIQPVGSVIDFAVTPDEIILDSLYSQQPITVTAKLINGSDTSFVNLSNSETGTQYRPTKSNIVSVDNKGVITALAVGTDTVEVRYNGNLAIVSVTVTSLCSVPKPVISIVKNQLVSSGNFGNQWFRNGFVIPDATAQTYRPTQTGVYTVQATEGCTSPMSDTIQLLTLPCNLSALDLGTDKFTNLFYADSTCTTLSVQGIKNNELNDYSFSWSTGDTTPTITVCPEKTTQYKLVVTKGGCTIEDSINVQVSQCPRNVLIVANPGNKKTTIKWTEPRDTFPASIEIPSKPGIEKGMLNLLTSYNGHSYYLSNKSYTWPVAKEIAGRAGDKKTNGHLLTIENAKENNAIFNSIKGSKAFPWIGLYDVSKAYRFRWVTNEPLKFTNWAKGEPYRECWRGVFANHYVQISDSTGKWYDNHTLRNPFICEFDCPLIEYRQINGPRNGSTQKPGVYTICYERIDHIKERKTICCFTVTITNDNSAARVSMLNNPEEKLSNNSTLGLHAIVQPNPSTNRFTIRIESNNEQEKIRMQLRDITGRVVETINGVRPHQTLQVGETLIPGIYFIAITQGSKNKVIKLVKL